MAPPACRILALPEALYPRPIKNALDALADPACGFGPREPCGLKTLQHALGCNFINRQRAQLWAGIVAKRIVPLLTVFCIAPANLMSRNVGGSAGVKGHHSRFLPGVCPCGGALFFRIPALKEGQPIFGGEAPALWRETLCLRRQAPYPAACRRRAYDSGKSMRDAGCLPFQWKPANRDFRHRYGGRALS
jgi:hypothetical protein